MDHAREAIEARAELALQQRAHHAEVEMLHRQYLTDLADLFDYLRPRCIAALDTEESSGYHCSRCFAMLTTKESQSWSDC